MPLASFVTLPLRTTALAVVQAVLGPRRWNILQTCVALAVVPLPLRLPFLPSYLFRPLASPLLATWVYGLSARLLAPTHRRSLAFWKRVIPIYAAYKRTQLTLALSNAGPQRRAKTWNTRHEWAATKVRFHSRSTEPSSHHSPNSHSSGSFPVACQGLQLVYRTSWLLSQRWYAISSHTPSHFLSQQIRLSPTPRFHFLTIFVSNTGQFLGARSDVVPLPWCKALRRLQDRVPPVPFAQIENTVRTAYHVNTLAQLFRSVDPVPLASATIAQVHRGEMPDGTTIALKTQYADQQALCAMDLRNLRRLAGFLQRFDMSFFDMHAVVDEFERQIPAEFDFVREAEMMTRIRHNLRRASIHGVVIPRVLPGLVSRRALAMTFIDGCRADNTVALKLWGINPNEVVKTIGRAYGQMLLCDGLAHCDREFTQRNHALYRAIACSCFMSNMTDSCVFYSYFVLATNYFLVSTSTSRKLYVRTHLSPKLNFFNTNPFERSTE